MKKKHRVHKYEELILIFFSIAFQNKQITAKITLINSLSLHSHLSDNTRNEICRNERIKANKTLYRRPRVFSLPCSASKWWPMPIQFTIIRFHIHAGIGERIWVCGSACSACGEHCRQAYSHSFQAGDHRNNKQTPNAYTRAWVVLLCVTTCVLTSNCVRYTYVHNYRN